MSEFHLDKVQRKHTHGDLGITPSGNAEEAYALIDFDRNIILTILTEFDNKEERGVVNDRVVANAALHSIADALWVVANDLAKADFEKMSHAMFNELRSRARGVMMTYAHNSKQGKAFSKIVMGER